MSYTSTLTAFCEFESLENLKTAGNKMSLPVYSNICQYLHKIKVKKSRRARPNQQHSQNI